MIPETVLTIINPESVLLGLALLLFTSAFTLSLFIGSKAQVVRPIMGLLLIVVFLLFGVVAIEFGGAGVPSYTTSALREFSAVIATHRWLIFQLPIILLMSTLIVLSVYGESLAKGHARSYRLTVQLMMAVSFASLFMVMFESML